MLLLPQCSRGSLQAGCCCCCCTQWQHVVCVYEHCTKSCATLSANCPGMARPGADTAPWFVVWFCGRRGCVVRVCVEYIGSRPTVSLSLALYQQVGAGGTGTVEVPLKAVCPHPGRHLATRVFCPPEDFPQHRQAVGAACRVGAVMTAAVCVTLTPGMVRFFCGVERGMPCSKVFLECCVWAAHRFICLLGTGHRCVSWRLSIEPMQLRSPVTAPHRTEQ